MLYQVITDAKLYSTELNKKSQTAISVIYASRMLPNITFFKCKGGCFGNRKFNSYSCFVSARVIALCKARQATTALHAVMRDDDAACDTGAARLTRVEGKTEDKLSHFIFVIKIKETFLQKCLLLCFLFFPQKFGSYEVL